MSSPQTQFGSLASYQKGGVEVINDDPKHYVYSNVFEVVGKAKPATFKGHYIKNVTLSSSMNPNVKLAAAEFNKF